MKSVIKKTILFATVLLCGTVVSVMAQEPFGGPQGPGPVISAPGSPAGIGQPQPQPDFGNGPYPAPGSGVYNPGPPPINNPAPMLPAGNPGPLTPLVVGPPLSSPDWQNQGTTNVIACGYDAQGVWRVIPLRISYNYNGAQYDVTVDSAWNPWTDTWNYGVDVPAFNTYYFLNGNYYKFYVNLSTGTWYFNL